MAKKKTDILVDAFNLLYVKLGSNLSSILKDPYLYPGEPRETDGGKYGTKWKNGDGYEILLQVEEATEYPKFQKTKAWANNNYVKKAYLSKGHSGYVFLFHKEFGNKRNKFTKATYDLLEEVANKEIGIRTLFQPGDAAVLGVSGGGVSGKSTTPSTIPPTSPILTKAPMLEDKKNVILYGPPGTGKTYSAIFKTLDVMGIPPRDAKGAVTPKTTWFENEDADRTLALKEFNALKSADRVVFTTFHQSMSYEDFVEGIKPSLTSTSVGYIIEDGIFKQISNKASKDPKNNYVLIIDEINRGNIANIFGELITLIEDDKRTTIWDKKALKYMDNPESITVWLPYTKKKGPEFGVPGNLYIIGTMNTADRSVEALDSALRRRFSFEEMMPKPKLLEGVLINRVGKTIKELLVAINERIEILKDREHQIGHSYFMKFADKASVEPNDLKTVFTEKIIPLLQEYFYGDYEKIQLVVGEGFISEDKETIEFAGKGSYAELPEKRFSIVKDPDMVEALKKLTNV